MPSPLKNLIRINDWAVDEKRRRLGELLELQANLQAQADALEQDLIREQAIAAETPEAGTFYGAYAEAVIERRDRLVQSIEKMDVEVLAAREEVRAAFRELKKYEVAQENRDLAEIKERNKTEQEELDEIGITRFVRDKATTVQ